MGEGPRAGRHPGRGAGRDLQAGPSGRAAVGRVGHAPTSATPSSRTAATTSAGSVATSSTASSAPSSTSSSSSSASTLERPEPDQPVLTPAEVLAAMHLPAAPGQRRAGLPPRRPGPLRQPPHPLGRRADPEPGPHRPVPHGAGRPRAHDHPGRRGHHAPDADQHPARWSPPSRSSSAPASSPSSWTRSTRCRASPTAVASRRSARAACRVSGPASRSATSTSATTAACARSRRRKARTSASSARWPPTPGSTSSASSSRRTARSSNGKVTDEIVYLAADEEEEYVVAQANAPLNPDGTFQRRPRARAALAAGRHAGRPQAPARAGRVLRRHHRDLLGAAGRGPAHGRLAEADRLGRPPRSSRSSSTTTPTAPSWAPTCRRQAVPLVRAEAPYIGTGIEARAARDAADMIIAEDDGDGHRGRRRLDHRRVQDASGRKVYRLLKFERSNQDTCINQKPRVREGDKVKQGRHPRRRPLDRQRRAGPRQEPASSPSCRGRATTSRTPSSSPSAW